THPRQSRRHFPSVVGRPSSLFPSESIPSYQLPTIFSILSHLFFPLPPIQSSVAASPSASRPLLPPHKLGIPPCLRPPSVSSSSPTAKEERLGVPKVVRVEVQRVLAVALTDTEDDRCSP
ncbi:unnamed protein product, partial [Urochloa humidicola]